MTDVLQTYFNSVLFCSRAEGCPTGTTPYLGFTEEGWRRAGRLISAVMSAVEEYDNCHSVAAMLLFEQDMISIATEFGLWYTLPGGEGPYNEEEL